MTDQNIIPELEKPDEKKHNWTVKLNPKKTVIVILVLAVLGFAYYYKNLLIAASVNGHLIPRSKITKLLEKQGGRDVLDTLINNELIEMDAQSKNITVSNEELDSRISSIRTQIESQGNSLEDALITQKMTMDDLKSQISIGLKFEKLLADKASVSNEEVDQYIKDNSIELVAGKEEEMKNQVREQIKQGKINSIADQYLTDLRTNANIKTYVNY